MKIELRPAYDDTEAVRALFCEYTDMLVAGDPEFAGYLQAQRYDDELTHPEVKYAPPKGRLYIAWADGMPAGCAALRRMAGSDCELKRLYVREAYRGHGIARSLCERLIMDARETGCKRMLLDTLPFLEDALRLYERLGFVRTDKYNDSPMESAVYMSLTL